MRCCIWKTLQYLDTMTWLYIFNFFLWYMSTTLTLTPSNRDSHSNCQTNILVSAFDPKRNPNRIPLTAQLITSSIRLIRKRKKKKRYQWPNFVSIQSPCDNRFVWAHSLLPKQVDRLFVQNFGYPSVTISRITITCIVSFLSPTLCFKHFNAVYSNANIICSKLKKKKVQFKQNEGPHPFVPLIFLFPTPFFLLYSIGVFGLLAFPVATFSAGNACHCSVCYQLFPSLQLLLKEKLYVYCGHFYKCYNSFATKSVIMTLPPHILFKNMLLKIDCL